MISASDFRENNIYENDRANYEVKIDLDPIDFCQLGLDGLNELLADDAVENGHLLEDLCYTWGFSKDGNGEVDGLLVRVSADASSWLSEAMLDDLSEAQMHDDE